MIKITSNSDEVKARLALRIMALKNKGDESIKAVAHFFEGKMVEKIALNQLAPPLSPETVKKKKSSRILFDKGDLQGQITSDFSAPMHAEVGVIDKGDKKRAYIAKIHEYGAPEAGIPERSFMRSAYIENRGKMAKIFSKKMREK
ncbi:hypothetical protein [Methanosarcina sp.]|uniref:hypothetical protein n=1 Tax=Methanosarcina sp. TaxID=2213 RepID=UPI003BB49DB7